MDKTGFRLSGSGVAIVVLAILLLAMAISGIRLCAVVSGSMEPNVPTWSLCFVNTHVRYEDIRVGDVVVYKRHSDGRRIIHRVIEITDVGMVTKGDANYSSDGLSVGRDNLVGKSLFHVPYLGYCGKIAQYPAARVGAIGLLLAFLLWDAFGSKKEKKNERKREEQEK